MANKYDLMFEVAHKLDPSITMEEVKAASEVKAGARPSERLYVIRRVDNLITLRWLKHGRAVTGAITEITPESTMEFSY